VRARKRTQHPERSELERTRIGRFEINENPPPSFAPTIRRVP